MITQDDRDILVIVVLLVVAVAFLAVFATVREGWAPSNKVCAIASRAGEGVTCR